MKKHFPLILIIAVILAGGYWAYLQLVKGEPKPQAGIEFSDGMVPSPDFAFKKAALVMQANVSEVDQNLLKIEPSIVWKKPDENIPKVIFIEPAAKTKLNYSAGAEYLFFLKSPRDGKYVISPSVRSINVKNPRNTTERSYIDYLEGLSPIEDK